MLVHGAFAQRYVGVQGLVFLPVGALDGVVHLAFHAQEGEGAKRCLPVRPVIPYGFKEAQHPLLDQVVRFPADQVHGAGFPADDALVFFQQIVGDLTFSGAQPLDQCFIGVSFIIIFYHKSRLIYDRSQSSQS